MIQFGLRLHDAEKQTLAQVLPLVRQRGFTCAHLALSKSLKEVPNTPSALTPGYAAYLRRLFAKNELDIAVLGNYLNLAHPDAAALHAIQEKYYAHIRFASLLGCGMVGTETGAPNAEYKFCPECRRAAALALAGNENRAAHTILTERRNRLTHGKMDGRSTSISPRA